MISGLVAECLDALSALLSLSEVTLAWMPRHPGIPGNEEADKLARQTSAMLLLGQKPVLGIPKCSAREVINWTEVQHHNAWRDLPGHIYGKLFICRPCKKRADDLLKLSRHQIKMVAAIFTGHAPVRGTCTLWAFLMGIQPADSARRRLKQCSIRVLLAVSRRRLVSAIMSLGS